MEPEKKEKGPADVINIASGEIDLDLEYAHLTKLPMDPEKLADEAEERGMLDKEVQERAKGLVGEVVSDTFSAKDLDSLRKYAKGGEQFYLGLASVLPNSLRTHLESTVAESIGSDLGDRVTHRWQDAIDSLETKISLYETQKTHLETRAINREHDIIVADRTAATVEDKINQTQVRLEEIASHYKQAVDQDKRHLFSTILSKRLDEQKNIDVYMSQVNSLVHNIQLAEQDKEYLDKEIAAYTFAIVQLRKVKQKYSSVVLDLKAGAQCERDLAPLLATQGKTEEEAFVYEHMQDVMDIRARRQKKLRSLEHPRDVPELKGKCFLDTDIPSAQDIQTQQYEESVAYLDSFRKKHGK